jgi:hypothetical protein
LGGQAGAQLDLSTCGFPLSDPEVGFVLDTSSFRIGNLCARVDRSCCKSPQSKKWRQKTARYNRCDCWFGVACVLKKSGALLASLVYSA